MPTKNPLILCFFFPGLKHEFFHWDWYSLLPFPWKSLALVYTSDIPARSTCLTRIPQNSSWVCVAAEQCATGLPHFIPRGHPSLLPKVSLERDLHWKQQRNKTHKGTKTDRQYVSGHQRKGGEAVEGDPVNGDGRADWVVSTQCYIEMINYRTVHLKHIILQTNVDPTNLIKSN